VVVTPDINGYQLYAPDFPEIGLTVPSVDIGAEMIKQNLSDAVSTMLFPPAATPFMDLQLLPGQFVLQCLL